MDHLLTIRNVGDEASPITEHRRIQADVPASLIDQEGKLIDWLIDLTLGTLGGQHVDIRVVPANEGWLPVAVGHAM